MQQEGNKETEKTAEEVTQTKEMEGATALDPEEMEIESIKRTRETSQTSPQIGQEMKKRREEEGSAGDRLSMRTNENTKPSSATIKQTRAAPPVPPKPPRESSVGRDGERTCAREKGKTRPSEKRELTAARQQPKVNTRDVGIVVYFKKSSRCNIESVDIEKREQLREAIIRGEAKIHWTHPQITYEVIFNGFMKNIIGMDEVKYVKCPDKEFDKLRHKCIAHQGKDV